MTANRFLGVIFDMDGVLCDSEPFIRQAACEMFARRHQTRVRPEDFLPFIGTGEDRFLGGVAAQYGVSLDMPQDKLLTYDLYMELIRGRMTPLAGAVEFVAKCRRIGLKLAVATSADRVKLEGNLRQIGIPPASFDAIVTGSDIQRKKPFPDIFELAATRLGLPCDRCLVVEDAPSGLQAGKAAGAKCLGLTTSFDEATLRHAGADWTAPDLDQVPPTVLG
jgi:HAD superfamily hydrolase (TIGR01509 family)